MTKGQIVYMVLLCGSLWGGFIACLVYLARQGDEE